MDTDLRYLVFGSELDLKLSDVGWMSAGWWQAVEGLKWLQLGDMGVELASSAGAKLVKKLVWERWCPINSVRAPF